MAETAGFIFRHLLVLSGLAITCYVLGRALAWRVTFESAVEKAVTSATLGLAVLGQLLFLLGLAGELRKPVLIVLVAAIHVACWRAWAEVGPALQRAASGGGWRRRATLTLVAAAILAPFVFLAMYPPTAFDATGYHLPQAKVFAATGRLPILPNLVQPAFPAHGECLFATMLLLSDDVSAQGVELFAGLLTAGILFSWGRRRFGAAAGAMAGALYLGNPAIVYMLGAAYVDVGVALFSTGSLYALDRWRGNREGGWLAVAGASAGAAASTKYLGLFFVVLVAGCALLALRKRGLRRSGVVALLVLAAFVVPCHARIAYLTGNPLHPYFQRYLGQGQWTVPEADDAGNRLLRPGSRWQTLAINAVDVIRLPWDLVLARTRFQPNPPISPLYLIIAPVVLLALFRDSRVRRILLLAAVYAYLVWLLPRNVRYLFPSLALASLAWAGALQIWIDAAFRKATVARALSMSAALVLVLPGVLYAGQRFAICGPLPTNAAARDRFLERMLPAYSGVAYLNRTLGARYVVYVLGAPNLDYYADGLFFGEYNGPASYRRTFPKSGDASVLSRNLSALGVGYLMVPTDLPSSLAPPQTTRNFFRYFRRVFADVGSRVYELVPELQGGG